MEHKIAALLLRGQDVVVYYDYYREDEKRPIIIDEVYYNGTDVYLILPYSDIMFLEVECLGHERKREAS